MSQRAKQAEKLAGHFIDQLSDWSALKTRRLFGAVGLYRNGHVFAMVWQGTLYFKVDENTRKEYETAKSRPLGYVSEGEEHALKSYWEVPADVLEDNDELHVWADRAYRVALKNKGQTPRRQNLGSS
jgi:DNA transformation protein and related proteins